MTGTWADAATVPVPAAGGAARQAAGLPRLLPPVPGVREDLRAHLSRFGPLTAGARPGRAGAADLIDLAELSGLTGRGGAAFPVFRKLAAARRANAIRKAPGKTRPLRFAIANGAESEPASHKDAALLWHAPHLVLDGLDLVAEAIGATGACLYLHRGQHDALARALRERVAAGYRAGLTTSYQAGDQTSFLPGIATGLAVTILTAPPRFLAGQETALVNRLEGGPALPTFTPPRVPDRGIAVHNVETLAHLALIARYGPAWFRELGTTAEPGTMLVTVHTRAGRPDVREVAIGTRLSELATISGAQAVLVGGYHGTWLPARAAEDLTLDNRALATRDAALGSGVIAVLPDGVCGLAETARVARYLAAESAGQCGPCFNGLPRIATALAGLAGRKPARKQREDTERWLSLVTNRGACHHPDGTARFVRSALDVFAGELRQHAKGRCTATTREPFLPLPSVMPTTEAEWM